MLLIRRIEISNFVCFEHIEIKPSTNPKKPLTLIRAENGSGKTTLLRAIRWGLYGETGLPGTSSKFPIHPTECQPDDGGIETKVSILFETDGSSRNDLESNSENMEYELRRSVTTLLNKSTHHESSNFQRINENVQLLIKQRNGSWLPEQYGVDRVIEELLPPTLRDFIVMDADEATDFVGGSENKIINHQDVIEKTSFAVRALLGLEIFENTTNRLQALAQSFGRKATRATGSDELNKKQTELDELRKNMDKLEKKIENYHREKAELTGSITDKRRHLDSLLGSLGAHDELRIRLKNNERYTKEAQDNRSNVAGSLCSELEASDMLAALAAREVAQVYRTLQPLHDDGSIPVTHLTFVQSLLEKGTCVCGQDLSSQSKHREKVQYLVNRTNEKQEIANYLEQIFQVASALHRHVGGKEWKKRVEKHETNIANLDAEIDSLTQERRDIDSKLDEIDEEEVETTRGHINMLEAKLIQIERDLVGDQNSLEQNRKISNQLEGILRSGRRNQQNARDFEACEETTSVLVQILGQAYSRICEYQVNELSAEVDALFAKMAAGVVDDKTEEDSQPKETLKMIAKVGLRPYNGASGKYEIFAQNNRGRSMAPTEINGASRRILALSFVMGLCKVSRTMAPLIADSLLNFMSGSVRTNTLRIAAETATQPILLLTGSDLEAQSEINLVKRYAGATYTLTGQWQHTTEGGDVVNLTDERQVSLICECGPRDFCFVCERLGQAESSFWTRKPHY